MSVFSELKRRNVIRVGLLYVIASWIILQVTEVGVSLVHIPTWVGKLILVLMIVGFPLILMFSWVYEMTPDGFRKESRVDSGRTVKGKAAGKLNCALIVLCVLAVTSLIVERFLPEQPVVAQNIQR
jgi:hypothetical protein